jgi:hypothetical protein
MAIDTTTVAAPLACIGCHRALTAVFPDAMNEGDYVQPAEANSFTSSGTYGSRVFDPLDGSHVQVNVCDDCLWAALECGEAAILH